MLVTGAVGTTPAAVAADRTHRGDRGSGAGFTHDPVRDRDALYALLDASRAQQGLPALRRLAPVQDVAQGWSVQMASSGVLDHDPTLAAQLPLTLWASGENVGVIRGGTPAQLHQAWLASPPHRANLLDPRYDAVGIGVAYGRHGAVYATTDFVATPLP